MTPWFQVDTTQQLNPGEFSPQASTIVWRDYNNRYSAYTGARVTDANKDWIPLHYSGDSAIRESWDLLTARIRDLCRNDAVLNKLLHQVVTLVIGPGILTFSNAMSRSGRTDTFHDEFADQSDELFEYWAEHEADATGRMSFYDMQHLSFSEVVQVGACLWREVFINDPNRRVPLAYQLLEWEQLDRTMDRDAAPGRTRISNGIEFDRSGRPIAYWLYDSQPYDTQIGGMAASDTMLKSRRIPASQIIHDFLPDRISSNTGISWFSSLVQVSRDRDHYWTNELRSSALRALMAIHVKRQSGQGAFGQSLSSSTDASTGTRSVKMGYPSVIETGVNEDVSLLQSGAPPNDTSDWIKNLHLHTAMGGKLSLNRLLGDASEAVFASIKAAFLDDERTVSPIQKHQALHVMLPIRRRVNEVAASLGRYTVTPEAFAARQDVYQRFDWVAAGDPDLQPKDDGEAATDRMRTGRTTPQYEIARLGFHWRKTLRDWKRYFEELDRLGLEAPDFSKGQGGLYIPFRGPVEEQAPGVSSAPSTSRNGNGRATVNAR